MEHTAKFSAYKIALGGLLVALSVVFARFLSIMLFGGIVRVGFGSIPIMIAGILLGPFFGGICGAAADLIGVLINPQGTLHIGFTLSNILTAVIPSLFFLKNKQYSFVKLLIAVLCVSIVVFLGLNTIWLSQLTGTPFLALLKTRAISRAINFPIEFIVIYLLSKKLF